MKMRKILTLVLAVIMIAACFAGCKKDPTDQPNEGADLKGTYDITMWVSEKDGVAAQFQEQIDAFEAANPGIIINAQIEGVTEAESGSKVINDVASAPDIYCFAQDQLARLVQASALAAPGKAAAEAIKNANDAGSVAAATVGGTLYAYPLTSDNGYFMYYDKRVVSEDSIDSLEAVIADCEKAEKYFAFEMNTSAWYLASFFFGTGCVSEWTTDADGQFISVTDTFNSDRGLIAAKGMKKLVDSPYHLSSSSGAEFDAGAAVVVTGTWDFITVQNILGENMG
ncbi:MAG: extracellular solute-binding protein, partial [Clostridia bacterium]|nr:extracellular solute-binding protein [Clostridia bacterium]